MVASTAPGTDHDEMHIKMCGVQLTCQGKLLFATLVAGALTSAVGFALLQEGAIREEGFQYYGYMTLLTTLTMMVCGQLERILTSDTVRRGQLAQYVILSVLTFAGMAFTNASLKYINYPTRVLFKSSKLVPTMIMGTVLQGRRYSALEYIAALGLVIGIVLFTLGDSEAKPDFAVFGVVLILIGVFADAATSNYEEKAFFRVSKPASQAEVMTYASLFGSLWAVLAMLILPGYLFPDKYVTEGYYNSSTETSLGLCGAAVCGYVSVTFVLVLIRLYGATVTEMIKSMRKVISIVMSFVFYKKPFVWKYGLGFVFVVVSLFATQELQRRKGGDVQQKTDVPTKEIEAAGASTRMEEAPLAENVSDQGDPEIGGAPSAADDSGKAGMLPKGVERSA